MTIPELVTYTELWSSEYTSHAKQNCVNLVCTVLNLRIQKYILIPKQRFSDLVSSHLVPCPGHAAAGVPAQAGARQVRVCVLIIANPEVLTIAEDNIRLDDAAL